jgi:peptide/nickel transport system permease protein
MLRYIGRRIVAMIPTLFAIIVIGFFIIELPPGDYLTFYIMQLQAQGYEGAHKEAELLRKRYALDEPAYKRFFKWLFHFVQGDFGDSFAYRKPVRELIGARLAMTLVVSLTSLILAWVIGIPVGVYSATHQYSIGDQFFTVVAFVGVGVPSFVLALLLLVGGAKLLGFVPSGLFSPKFESAPWSLAKLVDLLKHLWVPALIVSVTGTAGLIRVMRGNLLDVQRLPYMQTVRAKGVKERRITWKYGVRNAIHPLVMSLGMSLPNLISSTTITGIVLNLPVAGPMYLQATRQQDVYLAGTILILLTVLLVIGNLLADILLALLDPRVRYG